jgi:hypothetical protein
MKQKIFYLISVHETTVVYLQLVASLSSLERLLKRFHGQPRVNSCACKLPEYYLFTANWREPHCGHPWCRRYIQFHEMTIFCVVDCGGDRQRN